MGYSVTYTCSHCGYSQSAGIGCGLGNFSVDFQPALDINEKEVTSININDPSWDTDKYILYSDLTLNKKPFFRLTPPSIGYGDERLLTKYNYCPKCERYKLNCEEGGIMWD